jgi:hypothetical protein
LQNFLDSIGHFPYISLSTASALAGLKVLRQRQYAGRNAGDGMPGRRHPTAAPRGAR